VDDSGNGYLKAVCDYVHLNLVRAKLLKTERPACGASLVATSRQYAAAGEQRPFWLGVDRMTDPGLSSFFANTDSNKMQC